MLFSYVKKFEQSIFLFEKIFLLKEFLEELIKEKKLLISSI